MAAAAVEGYMTDVSGGCGSRAVGSVAGVLSLLDEDCEELQVHAITTLERVVDEHWAEVASSIAVIESFAEEDGFPERKRASLLASRVFYHLGEMQDALAYALGAEELFDPVAGTEFSKTMLASGIDTYVAARQKMDAGAAADGAAGAQVDRRLEVVVDKMFGQCVADGDYQQAVGFAMESRRLDLLRTAVRSAANPSVALDYALRVCNTVIVSRTVRQSVLRELVSLFGEVPSPDHLSICQCHMFLDDPGSVAGILEELLKKSKEDALAAYQVAFDLSDNELQSFLDKVKERFPAIKPTPIPVPGAAEGAEEAGAAGDMETDEKASEDAAGATTSKQEGEEGASPGAEGPQEREEEQKEKEPEVTYDPAEVEYAGRVSKLRSILSGEASINLSLEFLFSSNHADLVILGGAKAKLESRNSVCHGAMVFANAIAHAGTTVDTFLRENLEWLSKAVNWAKFSATAGLGVIHKGHISQSRALMAPYLPRNGVSGSSYSEGGALYALGLIHANHGGDIKGFLLESLRNTTNETTQHGACLGLGLALLGTDDEGAHEALKEVMYTDSAVAGEAAGLSLGMLMVGRASDRTEEMLAYAHDTSHEKIIRGIAIGLAITAYALEEEADAMIEQMVRDQDPILRYGGMFAIGLAYRGTANNEAMRKLLHFAVSDVADDVRRAAVMNLGFVLCAVPEQCPRTVSLLAESYNPHVRYGAAMAVGISAAGTGIHEACALLEPLLSDAVDFVRQGALIAMAMVLVQQPEARVASFRKQVNKFIGDKHEDTMCKMGAVMAIGILDAGGRNMTISLRSRSGFFKMNAVVGLALFTQYWFWYPLSYMLSLAVAPTAVICVNEELKMPKMSVLSNAKPSLFAYPPPWSAPSSKVEAVATKAVLSTAAARAKTRAKKEAEKKEKEANEGGGGGGGDASEKKGAASEKEEGPMDMETDAPKEEAEKKAEPAFSKLLNPSRVVPQQERFIKFEDERYRPIRLRGGSRCAGIIVVEDMKPDEPVELVSGKGEEAAAGSARGPVSAPAGPSSAADDEEAEPPAAFDLS